MPLTKRHTSGSTPCTPTTIVADRGALDAALWRRQFRKVKTSLLAACVTVGTKDAQSHEVVPSDGLTRNRHFLIIIFILRFCSIDRLHLPNRTKRKTV
ncbi:unnamed protein product [Protopolystoma xenopodis]|uniref:Uncharacterized protein n=1 Tax=Protopolystoma xenopodis TaxID=117903 RepID=A0A3S5FCN2_9PLAT|nr:unnamed protein product [Protopolystoma xenopodis]